MGMANANKRINLTAPLISVRHHGGNGTEPTGAGLPESYKADATSGALVGRTGAVPFGWERRPSHPKSVRTRRATPVPPCSTIIAGDDPKRAAREPAAAAAIVASARAREEERFSDALSREGDDVSCVTVNCSATTMTGLSDAPGSRGGPPPRARGGSVMMERFLPAAHAVAAGSPQSNFRKAAMRSPAAASAHTGGGDRSPARAIRRLPFQHIAAYQLPHLSPGPGGKNEQDDDAESDAHSTAGFASRRCGWLPGRCVKSARLRGAGRLFLLTGGGTRRASDPPLLRRSRNGQQHAGDDHGMQSWEEVYIKSLLRSGGGGDGGGLLGPAAAVASELDRTVRELYRHRGGQAVQPKPKASHLGLLLVLDRSNEDCGRGYKKYHHGSSAQSLLKTGDVVPLPPPSTTRSSPKSGNELGRGVTGDYGFPLLLEDADAVAAGREMAALSPTPLLPLPLPASPTESWLSRALPSVSARPPAATSFLGLHVQLKKHAPLPSWCAIDSARGVDHDRQRRRRVHDLQK